MEPPRSLAALMLLEAGRPAGSVLAPSDPGSPDRAQSPACKLRPAGRAADVDAAEAPGGAPDRGTR